MRKGLRNKAWSFADISSFKYRREINAPKVVYCQMGPGMVTHYLRHSTYQGKYTALENIIVTKILNAVQISSVQENSGAEQKITKLIYFNPKPSFRLCVFIFFLTIAVLLNCIKHLYSRVPAHRQLASQPAKHN